jgi:hypothetical protein
MDLVAHQRRLCVVADKLDVVAPPFITKMEHKMGVVANSVLISNDSNVVANSGLLATTFSHY